jgi:hypothetical protein
MKAGDPLQIGLAVAVVGLLATGLLFATRIIEFRVARMRAREVVRDGGEIAAAAEPRPPSHPLPIESPGFVNRKRELRAAEDCVYDGGEAVVVFEGERGIGKSQAAVALAHRLRCGGPRGERDLREHEFIWVRGSGDDEGQITLADIGRALNVETEDRSVSAGSEVAKLHRLRRHLASRRTVLVLDSLRLATGTDSDGVREFLKVIPEGSLVIAAAGNRGDGLDAAHIELEEFAVKDVEELVAKLVDRLNLKPTEQFDRVFAERLHEVVGGDPNTITMFLQACKGSGEMPGRRLEALGSGVGLDQLYAEIWEGLKSDARAVLLACDCLGGKATAEQLAAACEISESSARRVAEVLYREGLLNVTHSAGRPAFVCSRALAIYVAAATPADDRSRCLRTMAAHYLSIRRADRENARALLPEVDALRAVFDRLDRQAGDEAVDPAVEEALQDLFAATADPLLTLGFFDDRIATAWHAYHSSIRTGNYRCASLACEVIASTYALREEFESARTALCLGQVAAEASHDPAEAARQMYSEGFLRYREGASGDALESIEGAEDRAVAGDDLEVLVDILDMRAATHLYRDEIVACRDAARRSLAVCDEIGWERAKSFPLRFLAEVETHRGNLEQARELVEQARGFAARYDDQRQLARISLTAARIHLFDRDLDSAAKAARSAVSEAERLGLPPEEGEARALADAIDLSNRSPTTLDDLASRRPTRLTQRPVGGD